MRIVKQFTKTHPADVENILKLSLANVMKHYLSLDRKMKQFKITEECKSTWGTLTHNSGHFPDGLGPESIDRISEKKNAI